MNAVAAGHGAPYAARMTIPTNRLCIRLSACLLPALVLAGCATAPPAPSRPPGDVHSEIVRRMPARVADREGWASDIQAAFSAQKIEPNSENICAVLAVTEQESGYVANPSVANLPKIARGEIDRDLSEIYEDLIGTVPLGKRLFADLNPVQTGGPMQVGIPFAESNASSYPYPVEGTIRDEVFTRRGGMYFGIAHLLGYQTPYTRKVHRFADYNAGWYASRNAAFQNAVALATGTALALDGDVLNPGAPLDKPGQTERAVRMLSAELDMDERAIRKALERGDRLDFDDTGLYAKVFALAEARARKPLPRAMIPGIKLESPKITRELTTAWFATRVDERYQRCLAR